MKKFTTLLLVFTLVWVKGFGQEKSAYRLLDAKGKKTTWSKLLAASREADVICFGEFHNNPISHWLQLELTRDLQRSGKKLSAGAEMFEADQQTIMMEYFNNTISTDTFEARMRNWPNYETDYEPWLEFLRENKVAVNATNVPRYLARAMYKGGPSALDTCSADELSWMAPLPVEVDFELKSYKDMIANMGGHGTGENLVRAQALKDATMAHFILRYHQPGSVFMHLNGAYHSDLKEGIVWYLRKAKPELRILTITTRELVDMAILPEEDKGVADYIIAVPESMTKTH